MRSFEQRLNDLHQRGVEVVGVSVDSPEESRKLSENRGYHFPILSDPNAAVIQQFGVLHRHGGENGRDIARPAEFLIDNRGTVRWVNLTNDIRVRARPEAVLEAIDRLPPQPGL